MYPETTEIFVSKKKTALLLLGAAVLVFGGSQMIAKSGQYSNGNYVFAIGIAGVLFFGAAFIYGLFKLFQKRPAYILNETGFVYDTRNPELHTVKWSEINGFGIFSVGRTRSIFIGLYDPQALIDRQTSGVKRKLMQMSVNQYQAPLSIATNSLTVSHNEMLNLLESYHKADREAQMEQ